ncbi:peptidoglycan-binding domain-containing protein [Thalassovita taeanensis]|uniref:Putative peptidoglycan binding domain-containing protein n=1 Tax=Thalassovita taeanensis TaxID=657014 RepID=A0A1H9ERX0_9RHOB|nr:peptidoglycan-binding domain-containing protein [Thalassovita taeanensis]SEQ28365.1 Putative peptidoglycan binding domain-containing protein [Thalassovita taeanensis]
MTRPRLSAIAALSLIVAGCDTALPLSDLTEPQVSRRMEMAPPGAAPGTCWGKHITPAIVETATEQILLQPAEVTADGTLRHPAMYKTETHQAIVRERKETWFETPCDPTMTAEFIASLQRALQARGLYRGAVTGEMDSRTRAAVRKYQKPQGLDSGILSLAAARKLGLIAVPRTTG